MHQGEKHSINFLLNSYSQNQRLENAGGSAGNHNGNTVPSYENDATGHDMTPVLGERGSPIILTPEDSDGSASSFFPAMDLDGAKISSPTLLTPIPVTPRPRQSGYADHLIRDNSSSKTESPIPRQQTSVRNHKHPGAECTCKKRSRRDFSEEKSLEFGSPAPGNIHPRWPGTLPFAHKGIQVPCSSLASPFHALSLRLAQGDHSHWSICCSGALFLEHIYNQSVQSRLFNSQDQCEGCREGKGACFGSKRDKELKDSQVCHQSSPAHLRQFEGQEESEQPLITMYKESNKVKLPATRNKKKRKENQHSLTFHNLLVNNGGRLSMVEDNNNNNSGGGNETIYVNCIFK